MRRVLVSALILPLVGCSDFPGSEDGLPPDLTPANALAVVRVASPDDLSGELGDLGAPPASSLLPLLGVMSPAGVDTERPWFLVWAEDTEDAESPAILLPLSDRGAFEEAMEISPSGYTTSFRGDHVLLAKGPLPEMGRNSVYQGFSGDIEAHVDLAALREAYAEEIQLARDSLQGTMEAGLQAAPRTSTPGLDPAALGEVVQAELDLAFDILEQSEVLGFSLDLEEGRLDWSARWSLEEGTPWGNLVSDQEPTAPSGLGRVNLERPVVFWTNHDLSGNQELLSPFFEAMSGFMRGLDPGVLSQLVGQRMEGVMSMGWGPSGLEMEAVYTLPSLQISEYRDLVREQVTSMEFAADGIEFEYRQNVGEIGGMEVDLLIQEIQAPGVEGIPFPMERMEVYYGWGEEEILTVMASGDESAGMESLRSLFFRQPGPLPDHVRSYLDRSPEELLMVGWLDMGGLMEGVAAMSPGAPDAPVPEGLPPMIFYATSEGPEIAYGGSMDIKALAEAASAVAGAALGGGRP
ncbi:MAG: hypothetical protein HKO65_14390 [Gemmatimonadetes bacterium]|nr:hypothetical protein [Gemmatimonadota bacterium]